MSATLARQRYLRRHIEPDLPASPRPPEPWHHVLVIPAYRESAALLERLKRLPDNARRTLVILVLNRPDSDPDQGANAALRDAVSTLRPAGRPGLSYLNRQMDLYVHDLDSLSGPIAASRGVGLARKIGCDIAFRWMSEGAIDGRWICSTDADAQLPRDYFLRLASLPASAGAACYPFRHVPGDDSNCDLPTALYELRLHQYVLGLEYAGSPYAWHSLGSCLAVAFDGYAFVRGIPKRSGGEDFYLLNKLAKTGGVIRLGGECIELESRVSQRAPFGTGPAVAKISAAQNPLQLPLFYHPACFAALRAVLACVPQLAQSNSADLRTELARQDMPPALQHQCCRIMEQLGLATILGHCRRQARSPDQFQRQFHQWFDGFRSLKFIHGIRDAGWPACSLAGLQSLRPRLWPDGSPDEVERLRRDIARHWGWTYPGLDKN